MLNSRHLNEVSTEIRHGLEDLLSEYWHDRYNMTNLQLFQLFCLTARADRHCRGELAQHHLLQPLVQKGKECLTKEKGDAGDIYKDGQTEEQLLRQLEDLLEDDVDPDDIVDCLEQIDAHLLTADLLGIPQAAEELLKKTLAIVSMHRDSLHSTRNLGEHVIQTYSSVTTPHSRTLWLAVAIGR